MRCIICIFLTAPLFWWTTSARGDGVTYSYDGDVPPYELPGWIGGGCENNCFESIENGHFIIRWPQLGDWPSYFYRVAQPPVVQPDSLWVEWRFRSNHSIYPNGYGCDAVFSIHYKNIVEPIYLDGDAVVSFSGSDYVLGLPLDEFRTYRFESPDGIHFWFSVDGLAFKISYDDDGDNGSSSVQFRGRGGCTNDWIPNKENAWDFVRYGTISYGEQIVASDPPAGFVDARQHPALDRFTVRYDSANYVYIDDITVTVEGHEATRQQGKQSGFELPVVFATRRLDNGPPDVVEIVLDRPIPYNSTTRFTFDDGTLAQAIEFTYAPSDTDGNGLATLSDFAAFQNCFNDDSLAGACPVLDFDADADVDLFDFAEFQNLFMPAE